MRKVTEPQPWPKRKPRFLVSIELREVRGRVEVVGLCVEPLEPYVVDAKRRGKAEPLTAADLRSVPLGKLADEARREYAEMFRKAAKEHPVPHYREWFARALEEASPDRPRKGAPRQHDYKKAAEVYLRAWEAAGDSKRRKPTHAVAVALRISDAAAAKVVQRLRRDGLLPPTRPGVAGGSFERPKRDRRRKR